MIDLETYLKTKLNESIDAELGPPRPAPPFEPTTPSRTWVRPVLAAASVLVVAGAAVAIGRVATSNHATQPPATGHHTQPVTPTPTNHSDEPAPLRHTLFHGAKIAVPAGWTVQRQQDPEQLCMSASKVPSACAIRVTHFVPGSGSMLDVDEPGGFYGDAPQVCAPQVTPAPKLTATATRDLGGRQSQWRVWEIDCSGGKTIVDDQYVTPSSPGFVLYAFKATADVRAAIDAVSQQSQLPAQNAPLWLTDRGQVHSVSSSVQDGKTVVHLVLARFTPDGAVGNPPTLVSYDLSQAVYQQGDSPRAGATVYLATDGHTVQVIEKR